MLENSPFKLKYKILNILIKSLIEIKVHSCYINNCYK